MGTPRPPFLLVALLAACASPTRADPGDARPPQQLSGDAANENKPDEDARAPAPRPDADAYERALERIEAKRAALGAQFTKADDEATRDRIRDRARRYVVAAVRDTIFPAWMGTPWGLGKNSTSTRPHQPGMTVGCSYFVTSVLMNAGLRLDNRYRFAQAPALHIQRSLAPSRLDLHRFLSIPARELEHGIARLGDGLYLIGLNNHIGFVLVRDSDVRFVHASYAEPQVVRDEPLVDSAAIAASRKAGYFVTPVFRDDRLVDLWLTAAAVPFQRLGAR